MRYVLFVVCGLFVVCCCLSCDGRWSLFGVCRSLRVRGCLFVVCCLLFCVDSWVLLDVCCFLCAVLCDVYVFVACCVLLVVCCLMIDV